MKKSNKLFLVNSANEWIDKVKHIRVPNMLFSELWYENELCILFADANVGKTILAVQIANGISKGYISDFKYQGDKQKVLYFDFELTAKQFQLRYTANEGSENNINKYYRFDDNLIRVELNPDFIADNTDSVENIIKSIEECVLETESKVVIVDNISFLLNDGEKANIAAPLMKNLKRLKTKYGLSILVLAHTPKRDVTKAINLNHLAGSKQLMNFTDSCFAINKSFKDESIRYIKQIKARNTEILYGDDNVIICNKVKASNILELQLMGYGRESEHLKELSQDDVDFRIMEAARMKAEGVSNTQIGKEFGVSEGAVRKWLKKYNDAA